MKKAFTLIASSLVSLLSANGYQNQPNSNSNYSQDNNSYYQGSQGNYDNDQDQYNHNQQGYDRYQGNEGQKGMTSQSGMDQQVSQKLHDLLSSKWSKEYQNVSYTVQNGTVTLRGTVDSTDVKSKLEETVRNIEGVRQVNNQVTVSGSKAAPYNNYNSSNYNNSNYNR